MAERDASSAEVVEKDSNNKESHLEHQTENKRQLLSRNYDRAAWFYETSAAIYSANQIRASKKYQLKYIRPGDQVIYLGVGSGEDAMMAARHGAQVTCVDISSQMLGAAERKLQRAGLSATLLCQSAFDLQDYDRYDVCCANFFLNVFKPADMRRMMAHAVKLVRPGGKFCIADVALPQGNVFYRVFNQAYRKFAMASFWLLGLVPWHEDYDYPSHFPELGLELVDTKYFSLFPYGPVVYQSIISDRKTICEDSRSDPEFD